MNYFQSHSVVLIEEVKSYAEKLSATQPDKKNQLIEEHENYIMNLGKEWCTQISQVAQNLLAAYNASAVPNYAVSKALMEAGIPLKLINAACMKKFVLDTVK